MNSNKRDIYFEGKIYKDAAIADCEFVKAIGNPSIYIALGGLTSYPVQGSHNFKDEEDVTGRYELSWQINDGIGWVIVDEDWYNRAKEDYRRIVALPTPAPVAEQDDWFDRQTMQEVKKKIIEEIDSYPKDEIKQMAAAQNYAVDKTHPFNKLFTKLTDAFIAGVEWQKQNKQL